MFRRNRTARPDLTVALRGAFGFDAAPARWTRAFSDDELRRVAHVEARGAAGAVRAGDAALANLAGNALRDVRAALLARGHGVPAGADLALAFVERFASEAAASTADPERGDS